MSSSNSSHRIRCRITHDWHQQSVHTIEAVTNEYVDEQTIPVETPPDRPDDLIACFLPAVPANGDQSPQTDASSMVVKIETPPGLRIRYIRVFCSSDKLELFTGQLYSYVSGYRGDNIMEVIDDMVGYVFEIGSDSLDVDRAMLKFFPILNERQTTFDIYDIELHVRTVAPTFASASIDMRNVQAILDASSTPLSASAERMRQFLASATTLGVRENGSAFKSPMTTSQTAHIHRNDVPEPAASTDTVLGNIGGQMAAMMRQYLAEQLHAMESRLQERIAAAEQRQSAKLDRILALLQSQQSNGISKTVTDNIDRLD